MSNSTETAHPSSSPWLAGATLFSGRPDPVWPVHEARAAELQERWESLAPARAPAPVARNLGYRGCFLRRPPHDCWFAFDGVITHTSRDRVEARHDAGRVLEKLILATAPAGMLPELPELELCDPPR